MLDNLQFAWEEVKTMAESYQMEVDKVKELLGENGRKQVLEDICIRKAVEFVVDNAKETKTTAKKSSKKAETPEEEQIRNLQKSLNGCIRAGSGYNLNFFLNLLIIVEKNFPLGQDKKRLTSKGLTFKLKQK